MKKLSDTEIYKLFKPELSPKKMLELGVFGGSYFENNIKEYPKSWFVKAKTQYSFSTDPKLKGAPSNHEIPIREVRLSSGAEFIVVVCGSIMTMPGLPRVPAANNIKLNKKGDVEGLF